MSAASSGGVLSSVVLTASTIADSGSANAGSQLFVEWPCRTHVDLDLFGCAIANRQRELFLDVLHDRVVELVAGNAYRLRGDDAAERDDGNFGRATADVDDHVAAGLVDRHVGTDRGCHRLFDDVDGLARPGVFGRVLHGALLDAGDARWHADHHARSVETADADPLQQQPNHLP